MPDDGDLADHLLDWVQEEPTRRRILAANPAHLYGCPAGQRLRSPIGGPVSMAGNYRPETKTT